MTILKFILVFLIPLASIYLSTILIHRIAFLMSLLTVLLTVEIGGGGIRRVISNNFIFAKPI
jgi:hypothetical protein